MKDWLLLFVYNSTSLPPETEYLAYSVLGWSSIHDSVVTCRDWRKLAKERGINPKDVLRAIQHLKAKGWFCEVLHGEDLLVFTLSVPPEARRHEIVALEK